MTSKEVSVWSLGLLTVPDTCQRFMYQRGSQAFGDSGLVLATLWLSALHCFTLFIKGSLEGREEAGWISGSQFDHLRVLVKQVEVQCFWEDQTRKNAHPSHVASFTLQAIVFCPLTGSMDAKANTSSGREPTPDLKINPYSLSLAGWFW